MPLCSDRFDGASAVGPLKSDDDELPEKAKTPSSRCCDAAVPSRLVLLQSVHLLPQRLELLRHGRPLAVPLLA